MKIFDCIKQEEVECEMVECDIKIENYSGNLCWKLSKTKGNSVQVYCTDCKHFKPTCNMPDECFECYCKDCNCMDLEDSKDIEIRYKFQPKEVLSC